VGQNKNSHKCSAEGWVQRRRRRADTKSNGKNTTPVYMGLFFLFLVLHADGRIAIGSGQPMEEVLNDTAYAIHCKAIENTFTEELSPSDSAHLIPQREEAGPDLSKYSVGSSPH
jgi:hypothetical protein